jgi:membrane-associated phospholipid phosphatase
MVYGSIVFLLAYQADGWKRVAIGLAGVVGIALIAWSRILLHAHNRREVVVGLAVGILSAAIFLARVHLTRETRINARVTVALTLVVILALHGCRLPAEQVIDRIPSVACLG